MQAYSSQLTLFDRDGKPLGTIGSKGDRIVIAVPPPALRQLKVFDRAGRVVAKIGPRGIYGQPNFSPDGKNTAVMKTDPQKGKVDIWNYEVATGKGTAITNDNFSPNAPVSTESKSRTFPRARVTLASIGNRRTAMARKNNCYATRQEQT
jgi:hypothetical protein